MVTRYEAFMDGIPLSSIAPEIIVKDIVEKDAKTTKETYSMASGVGSRFFRNARESLTVTIKIEIHAYGIQRRQDIMGQVQVWGKGQYLSVNTRPGKRLSVRMDAVPVIPSALKWTQDVSINFVAHEVPYWESEMQDKLILTGEAGNGIFRPSGTVDCVPVEFTVKNIGDGTMSLFSAFVGEQEMTFENLSVLPGETFSIEYVDGILSLPVANRTAESVDDLMAECAKPNEVSFTADVEVEVTFKTRGRYN